MSDPWGTMPHASPPSPPAAETLQISEVPPRRRRALPTVFVSLVVVVGSLLWGVATASADATFGPHLARYAITLDGQATVDLGPLGTLVIDSPVPVLGARVTVKEIPSTLSAVDLSTTLDSLSDDLREYLELFGAPEQALRAAIHALMVDAMQRAALAAVLSGGTLLLLRALLGASRRSELAAAWQRHHGTVSAGVVVVLVLGGTLSASDQRAVTDDGRREASSVFDDTPLEGARITGRLSGLIDTYGGYAVDAYRENEAFYGRAVATLDDAWDERTATDTAAASRSLLLSPLPVAPAIEDPIVAVVVSDLHCNVGMAQVIKRVAELSSADLVLNAGDSTMDGTAVESYCVNAFADAVPSGADYVIADGNHDSTVTAAQERAAGAKVLDGRVIEVKGLRILGESDPHATRIGSGTSMVGAETATALGTRLADVACADGDVDLLLIHTPTIGTEALTRGCVPSQVSGHWHRRIGPLRVGEGVRYVNSSSAGAILNEPTVGPLRGTAELTILRFDPATGDVIDARLVLVRPDGSVTVGAALTWPSAPVVVPRLGDPV